MNPFRVVIKAILLYAAANLAFAFFYPPVGKLSIYNWLVPGRERVPYEREVDYYSISHTIPVFEDMDAMYGSHILSRPKKDDEFRLILIGDSSTWGFELRPADTLSGRINSLHLTTCDGKRIVSYNAAFPLPYVMKDLLILDKMQEYKPDMFLWLVTLDAFSNRTVFSKYFLAPHSDKVEELVDTYNINNLDLSKMKKESFWDHTIIGQRVRLKRIFLLQMYGLGWAATGLDYHYQSYPSLSQDQSDDELFFELPPGELHLDELLFDVLIAGVKNAGRIPVLFVNEPIFIAGGKNNNIRYNEFYPRWAYDEYRSYLGQWMDLNNYNYRDTWNLLPSSEFTSTPFHRSPLGEQILAKELAQDILNISCNK